MTFHRRLVVVVSIVVLLMLADALLVDEHFEGIASSSSRGTSNATSSATHGNARTRSPKRAVTLEANVSLRALI